MQNPIVSIIIPCYNGEKYVSDAIQSALDQTYASCEVIVVDDGSSDGSLEIIQSFGDQIVWESGPNQGGCKARNRGIDLAKGKYIKFFDADDLLIEDAIEKQVRAMELLPLNAIPYGQTIDLEDGSTLFNGVRSNRFFTKEQMVAILFRADVITCCPLHRREMLEDTRFDPEVKRGQEWDFHLRLALNGCVFERIDCPVFRYRTHFSESRVSGKLNSYADLFRKRERGVMNIWKHYGSKGVPWSLKCSLVEVNLRIIYASVQIRDFAMVRACVLSALRALKQISRYRVQGLG